MEFSVDEGIYLALKEVSVLEDRTMAAVMRVAFLDKYGEIVKKHKRELEKKEKKAATPFKPIASPDDVDPRDGEEDPDFDDIEVDFDDDEDEE